MFLIFKKNLDTQYCLIVRSDISRRGTMSFLAELCPFFSFVLYKYRASTRFVGSSERRYNSAVPSQARSGKRLMLSSYFQGLLMSFGRCRQKVGRRCS
jgi:hypothetical protein